MYLKFRFRYASFNNCDIYYLSGLFPHKITFKTPDKNGSSKLEIKDSDETSDANVSSEKNKSDSDSENSSDKKRRSKSVMKEPVEKKQKTDSNLSDDEDEDSHLKTVADKLEKLKQSTASKSKSDSKDKRRVEDDCPSAKRKMDPPRDKPEDGPATTESKWMTHDELEVFTSKGVIHRSKVGIFLIYEN